MADYIKREFLIGNCSGRDMRVDDIEISDLVYHLSQNSFEISGVQAKEKTFSEEEIKSMKSQTFAKPENQGSNILQKYTIEGVFTPESYEQENEKIKIILTLENHDDECGISLDEFVKYSIEMEKNIPNEILKPLFNCLYNIYSINYESDEEPSDDPCSECNFD